jgi:hypothetical protein
MEATPKHHICGKTPTLLPALPLGEAPDATPNITITKTAEVPQSATKPEKTRTQQIKKQKPGQNPNSAIPETQRGCAALTLNTYKT